MSIPKINVYNFDPLQKGSKMITYFHQRAPHVVHLSLLALMP